MKSLEEDDDVQNVYSNANLLINYVNNWYRPWYIWINLFFEDGKILDVIEMPTMNDGKKTKDK